MTRLCLPLVFVVALAARAAAATHLGGLFAGRGYDEGVYYASATMLSFGQVPYRDFVLLHPPGIVLGLLPFAELGRLTSDSWGLAAARVAWMAVGAANATLVAVVARRYGPWAAITGGLLYALWPPLLAVESTPKLEPLVSLCLLGGLALATSPRLAARPSVQVLAGLALGVAPTVKIWAIAPGLLIAVWASTRLAPRARLRLWSAAAAGATAVCLPFFVAAPSRMWELVVVDQLGRERIRSALGSRWLEISGLHTTFAGVGAVLAGATVAGLTALALLLAWRRGARLPVGLVVGQLAVLFASPTFFDYYPAYVLPALAVCVGVAVQALTPSPTLRALVALVLVVGVVTTALALPSGRRFPAASLRDAVNPARCVTADSAVALIELDVLSRDLARGCRVEADVTGPALALGSGPRASRSEDPRWQRQLMGYLASGDVVVLMRRPQDNNLSPENAAEITSWPLLAAVDHITVRRRPGSPSPP